MNNLRMIERDEETDGDAEVTWEDQQRINSFSKLNNRLRGIQEKLDGLKEEKDALDDLATEIELADESDAVLYRIGEAFFHLRHSQATKRLERDQSNIDTKVATLTSQSEDCQKDMAELKVKLYAKFGRAINLDE
ncbi:Prefoldin, subunit 4 [Cylindrobasidium torrendii FP15055 ss-10]|uniref:Prefoldin subunit 4 n=1 Tax=Cylindrobasidium torrendii FP15055 ss-10 TaxID=1314674 RepID=A0A0D7AUQ1_9AGAR|nr:Prefoldin, subunit 4 [Cylindrobasidium torrendii FP15055 ss-10]